MIEVIATVCLMNDPNLCDNVVLQIEGDNRMPYTCVIGGQKALMEWSVSKPTWIIKNWDCRDIDTPVIDYFATKE